MIIGRLVLVCFVSCFVNGLVVCGFLVAFSEQCAVRSDTMFRAQRLNEQVNTSKS